MENEKRHGEGFVHEPVYSQSVKAGKRIYYIDVKPTRNGELYLALTESKKFVTGEGDDAQVSFEKHKIFLYPEDFDKVLDALHDAVGYVEEHQGKAEPRPLHADADIHLDLDF